MMTTLSKRQELIATIAMEPPVAVEDRRMYSRTQRLRIPDCEGNVGIRGNLDPEKPSIRHKMISDVETASLLDRARIVFMTMDRLQQKIEDSIETSCNNSDFFEIRLWDNGIRSEAPLIALYIHKRLTICIK
ncbi:hypothetical protein RB195_020025 [Necator americanus]|uniref:Glycosyltransferase 2-like domain-containing protein n=1 Tax=Necator americanus TaxID=51031 RepID=A0ABR1CJ07_NECAM